MSPLRARALSFAALAAIALSSALLLALASTSLATAWRVACAVAGAGGLLALVVLGRELAAARRDAAAARSVSAAATRVADGDLTTRASAPSPQGREPVDAFNRMSAAIQSRVRDLEDERHRMALAINVMADGLVALDEDARVRLINPAAERMLGVSAQDARGRPLAQSVRDPELLELVSRATDGGAMRHAQIDLLHQRRLLNVIASPIRGQGRSGALLTLQDLTSLRQVETTRREFVSNVSHELRSPLASASALLELLEEGGIDDREVAADFLLRIRDSVARMTTLVEELLELASLESGQMPIHLSPVDVARVVDELTRRVGVQASAARVEIVSRLPRDLPRVMAEERKLDQALSNLVENALKFTPSGGRVEIAAAFDSQWVEIAVSDTGVGIPREHLPHVFERFYKVDRARREGGSGLGLAIVKHLAQAQGGDISATSVEGEGSAFTLRLRRAS